MEAQSTIYSQHFKGLWDVVADNLSRDFHLSDTHLTNLLKHSCPQQSGKNFLISPLKPSIISWIDSKLQELPERLPTHSAQMPSLIGLGKDGSSISSAPSLSTMNSSTPSPQLTESKFLEYPHKQSENKSFQQRIKSTYKVARARRLWTKWLRSSGKII